MARRTFPPSAPQSPLEIESKSMSEQHFLKARARSNQVMNCPISKDTVPKIGLAELLPLGQTGRMRLLAVQSSLQTVGRNRFAEMGIDVN